MSFIIVAAAAVLIGPQKHHRHHPKPWWVTDTFTGLDQLKTDDQTGTPGFYDPRTGFMYYSGGDCDGADLYEAITRDRYELVGQGFDVPNFQPLHGQRDGSQKMYKAPLTLTTKMGVKIGDDPKQLVALVGRPHKIEVQGSRNQFRVYHYERHSRSEGRTFCEDYTFKKGKLIEINLNSMDDNAG